MEQTQLSLDRPTSPSNEPSRAEEPAEIGISRIPDKCNDSKLDYDSSQETTNQNKADDNADNSEAENTQVNRSDERNTKFVFVNFDGSDSTDGTMKMEAKDEDGIVLELKSANSTPSFEEDSVSLSQNSDTRPSTSEGEYSSGKDDCDLLMTDVSKSDSVGETDINSDARIDEEEWPNRNVFDTDEKETTFMDSVVYKPETETVIEDRILNNNMAQQNDQNSLQEEVDADHIDDGTSKSTSLVPIHFQKKARCSELSATPPKKTQKRKVGSSKLCSQVGEAERGENKCHLVPNGLCKSNNTGRKVDGRRRGDNIVNLDLSDTNKDKQAEIKGDRVTVRIQDSDCESDTSLLPEDDLCCLERFRFVRKHLLTLAMTLSVIIGIILGSALRSSISPTDQRRIIYLRFPGQLFVNILHMLVIPLTWSTLVSNVATMNARSLRKLGLRSLFYYSVTTFIALVTGIILAMTAQPGKFDQLSGTGGPVPRVNPVDAVLDLLRNTFPDNIIVACFMKFTTQQVLNRWPDAWPTSPVGLTGTSEQPQNLTPYPDKNGTNVDSGNTSSGKYSTSPSRAVLPEAIMQVNTSELYRPIVTHAEGTNFLGLVLAAIVVGAVISSMGQTGRPLHDFFCALSTVTMKITRIVMLYSPVGIVFIVAAKVVEVENPELTFHRLLMYTITVLVGLLGHGFVILPLVYFLMTRKNPVIFMYGIAQGIITALATSSSAATLPILLRCLERKNQVSSHVARFVAPVGAVINLNGSALYQAMACIFIAQHRSVDLTISQLALMSLIATLSSIGAKGIPQAGLITLVAVLTSVGLPQEDAVLILTVDWILDRVSTMVNVIGDAVGAGLISHLTAKEEARRRGFV